MIFAAAVLLTLGSLAFTLLVRPRSVPETEPVPPAKHLEEKKSRIHENLRDLQFEYRLGKLSDADYQAAKTELQSELAVVLAEIDQVRAAAIPAKTETAPQRKTDGKTCPHCGAKFPRPLKFCGECGKPMK